MRAKMRSFPATLLSGPRRVMRLGEGDAGGVTCSWPVKVVPCGQRVLSVGRADADDRGGRLGSSLISKMKPSADRGGRLRSEARMTVLSAGSGNSSSGPWYMKMLRGFAVGGAACPGSRGSIVRGDAADGLDFAEAETGQLAEVKSITM